MSEKLENTKTLENDVAEKETVTLKDAAKILGLKYHTARKTLMNDKSIVFINYGCKTLWLKDDILDFKRKHYVKAEV